MLNELWMLQHNNNSIPALTHLLCSVYIHFPADLLCSSHVAGQVKHQEYNKDNTNQQLRPVS